MPTSPDQYSTAWTIISLVILFAMIPGVLFLLSRAASAGSYPELDQMGEVRDLAAQLNRLSDQLLAESTRAFESAPGERKALDALIQLAETAESFRVGLTSGARSPSSSRRGFYQLMAAFNQARVSFPALTSYRISRDKFDQVRGLMEELKFFYEIQSSSSSGVREKQTQKPKPQAHSNLSPEDDPSSRQRPH